AENLNFAIPINYAKGLLGTSLNLSFSALRDQLISKVDPFKTSSAMPTRWKSLTSGTNKVIRFDGDYSRMKCHRSKKGSAISVSVKCKRSEMATTSARPGGVLPGKINIGMVLGSTRVPLNL